MAATASVERHAAHVGDLDEVGALRHDDRDLAVARGLLALAGLDPDHLALLDVVAELVDLLGLELHALEGGLGLRRTSRRPGPRARCAGAGPLDTTSGTGVALGQLGRHPLAEPR